MTDPTASLCARFNLLLKRRRRRIVGSTQLCHRGGHKQQNKIASRARSGAYTVTCAAARAVLRALRACDKILPGFLANIAKATPRSGKMSLDTMLDAGAKRLAPERAKRAESPHLRKQQAAEKHYVGCKRTLGRLLKRTWVLYGKNLAKNNPENSKNGVSRARSARSTPFFDVFRICFNLFSIQRRTH